MVEKCMVVVVQLVRAGYSSGRWYERCREGEDGNVEHDLDIISQRAPTGHHHLELVPLARDYHRWQLA